MPAARAVAAPDKDTLAVNEAPKLPNTAPSKAATPMRIAACIGVKMLSGRDKGYFLPLSLLGKSEDTIYAVTL